MQNLLVIYPILFILGMAPLSYGVKFWGSDFWISEILILITFLIFIYQVFKNKQKIKIDSVGFGFLLIIFAGLISFFKTSNIAVSLFELSKWLSLFLFYLLIVNNLARKDFKLLCYVLFVSLFLELLWAVGRVFTASPVAATINALPRLEGFLGHPNQLAGYLGLLLPLILISFETNFIKNKKILYLLLFLFTAVFIYTYSRTSWVAGFISIILLNLLLRNKKVFISSCLFLILEIVFIFFSSFGQVENRVASIANFQNENSFKERIVFWQTAEKMFFNSPILGQGLGNLN